MKLNWHEIETFESRDFICGHCGSPLASEHGWYAYNEAFNKIIAYIYIYHKCTQPTYFGPGGKQIPGVVYGNPVHDVPDHVESLYEEARNCTASNATTAAVLCCRKLLMNIAVSKGASEGQKFIEYVEYLSDKGFVPPDGKDWVDHIRRKGNEATHEIAIMEKEDAEELLSFVEMLLKFSYEFPAKMKRKTSADA